MTTDVCESCSYQDACELGFVDFLMSMQEMVVLGLAFALGWLVFRPVLSLLLGIPVRRAAGTGEHRIPIGLSKLTLSSEGQQQDLSLTKAENESSPEGSPSKPARPRCAPSILSYEEDLDFGALPGKSEMCSHRSEDEKESFGEIVNDDSFAGGLGRCCDWDVPGQLYHLALARELARRQDIRGSGNCIEAVRSAGGQVDQRTLRVFTAACAQAGKMDKAVACFQRTMAEGPRPDCRSFTALIRGLCGQGSVHQALKYFNIMLQRGHRPDASLVDALLECCVSQAQLDLAEPVISVMDAYQLRPSNTTLAASIRLCFARGELGEALAVFQEMPRTFGFVPNAYVHGVLISMCHRLGEPEAALQVYKSMLSSDCRPDARTYECLVRCCFASGQFLEAVSLVDEALGLQELGGHAPATRHTFIDSCVVEDLLGALGRRGLAQQLAAPLLQRLQACHFGIAEDVAAAVVRAAEAELRPADSVLQRRRMQFQRWRCMHTADLEACPC